jgi:hypothetical protein
MNKYKYKYKYIYFYISIICRFAEPFKYKGLSTENTMQGIYKELQKVSGVKKGEAPLTA